MSATMFAPDCTLTLATNQPLSLGNFSGGEVWVCPAPDAKAPLTQAPHDSASAAHPWEATRLGTTLDTWHTPTSFTCESLHCTIPWQGDRWVLTAYTCWDLEAFPPSQLAHLRSLGFPLPGSPSPQLYPKRLQWPQQKSFFWIYAAGHRHH